MLPIRSSGAAGRSAAPVPVPKTSLRSQLLGPRLPPEARDFFAAARLRLDLSPLDAGEVARAIGRIGDASPDTLDYMKKLLTNAGGG